jgi:uncharacterized protein (DUF486 family)
LVDGGLPAGAQGKTPASGGLSLRSKRIRQANQLKASSHMKTILLLVCSNIFMTLAWYGHLKFMFFEGKSILLVILVSWSIALLEYSFMVPANRLGYMSGAFTGYQLKIIQECIPLVVFVVFAWLVLKEKLTWNYGVSFGLLMLALYFATAFKPDIS